MENKAKQIISFYEQEKKKPLCTLAQEELKVMSLTALVSHYTKKLVGDKDNEMHKLLDKTLDKLEHFNLTSNNNSKDLLNKSQFYCVNFADDEVITVVKDEDIKNWIL